MDALARLSFDIVYINTKSEFHILLAAPLFAHPKGAAVPSLKTTTVPVWKPLELRNKKNARYSTIYNILSTLCFDS